MGVASAQPHDALPDASPLPSLRPPDAASGDAQDYPDVPLTDVVVQMTTAFAVQQYNKDRYDSTNYFKELRLLKAQSPVDSPFEYHLTVVLVETACVKRADKIKSYKKIQQCKALTGNHRQSISLNKAIVMTFRLVFLSCPNPIQPFRFHGDSTMTPWLVQESLQPFGVLSKLLETLIRLTVFRSAIKIFNRINSASSQTLLQLAYYASEHA
ncbi:Cystatin-1 [Crotalus adamanteus]|uniref:Cystatin-1 n=1 Tax=Crotalus adamanteus TaxID=8729 RepID=A0AAW1ANG0_CROAD